LMKSEFDCRQFAFIPRPWCGCNTTNYWIEVGRENLENKLALENLEFVEKNWKFPFPNFHLWSWKLFTGNFRFYFQYFSSVALQRSQASFVLRQAQLLGVRAGRRRLVWQRTLGPE
jgi:hypothetical protein